MQSGLLQLSLRTSLVITIMIMGVIGMTIAVITGETYQRQALDNRRLAYIELLDLEVHFLWDKVSTESYQLGMSIQASDDFRQALKGRDAEKIAAALDEHFHRAFVTLGLLKLKNLFVYDMQLRPLYSATEGDKVDPAELFCPSLFLRVKNRSGTERIKPANQICVFQKQLRLVALVPIGGLRPQGYLAVIVDPTTNLAQSGANVGFPLKVQLMDDTLLYQSRKWPDQQHMSDVLVVDYQLKAAGEKPVARFLFASNIAVLQQRLSATRYSMLVLSAMVILFAILVALLLLRRSLLNPLDSLTKHLRLVLEDKSNLKRRIHVSGTKEIEQLADDFNVMSHELNRLYGILENMAFTDELTGIPNRAMLMDRLKQCLLQAKQYPADHHFMLQLMDLNHFKAVNDTLGHNIGDKLLQVIATRLREAVRTSDTVARLGGDEFAIILNELGDREIATRISTKITELIRKPIIIDGHPIDIGMSIGIACYPEDGTSISNMLLCADRAMYYSKHHQLAYAFYDSSMETSR